MKSSTVFIIVAVLFIVFSCDSAEDQTKYPDVMHGSYQLTMQTDSMDINFSVELVTAADSAVYGYIESDTLDYEAPIGLDSLTTDSLFFRTYTQHLALDRSDMSGSFDFFNIVYPTQMTKKREQVKSSLDATRDQLPLKLDIEAQGMAWAAPVSGDKTYLVNDRLIYLAEKEGNRWKTTPVKYDTAAWEIFSIGLSPDQNKLIAHGTPKKEGLTNFGNGDFYMLYLDTPTSVSRIEHMKLISTSGFDIFPTFTPDGDILFSTFGEIEGIEKAGRGDIYIARQSEHGYQIEELKNGLNTEQPEAGPSVSADGRLVLFHKSNRDLGLRDRIHVIHKIEDGWSKPELVGPPVTRDFTWTYGGRIDPTGEYLFFNSGFRGQTEIFRIPISEIPDLAPHFD